MIDGKELRKLREESNIQLGLMAYYLNISVATLISIERNKKQLSTNQAKKIITLFNIIHSLN